MKNSISSIGRTTFYIIIGVVAIIAVIAGLIAGIGIIGALVMGILVGIVIFFGSVKELASSIVIGSLLKFFFADIKAFTMVWWTGPKAEQFFTLVQKFGYMKIIIMIFFFAYTLSFFTSRIQIFTLRLGGTIKSENEAPDKGGNSGGGSRGEVIDLN